MPIHRRRNDLSSSARNFKIHRFVWKLSTTKVNQLLFHLTVHVGFRTAINFIATLPDLLVHDSLFRADLCDLFQIGFAQLSVVLAYLPLTLRVRLRMYLLRYHLRRRLPPAHDVVQLLLQMVLESFHVQLLHGFLRFLRGRQRFVSLSGRFAAFAFLGVRAHLFEELAQDSASRARDFAKSCVGLLKNSWKIGGRSVVTRYKQNSSWGWKSIISKKSYGFFPSFWNYYNITLCLFYVTYRYGLVIAANAGLVRYEPLLVERVLDFVCKALVALLHCSDVLVRFVMSSHLHVGNWTLLVPLWSQKK